LLAAPEVAAASHGRTGVKSSLSRPRAGTTSSARPRPSGLRQTFRTVSVLGAGLIALLLTGCGERSSSKQKAAPGGPPDGSWIAPQGKGEVRDGQGTIRYDVGPNHAGVSRTGPGSVGSYSGPDGSGAWAGK
jgi:hypothetical protein